MHQDDFVIRATNVNGDTEVFRLGLLETFRGIDASIPCYHSPNDAYYMANEMLLSAAAKGVCVEFGCAAGGMVSKLSHVAKLIGKQYFVFDTFEGLPCDACYKAFHVNVADAANFKKGAFSHSLQEVSDNVAKHGCLDCCVFVRGRVEDTLPYFDQDICFAFVDLDLAPSAREVLRFIWRRITGNGVFTHEACIETYMEQLMDESWWMEVFGRRPPQLMHEVQSRPYGLYHSPCLDFLFKDK